MSNKKEETKSVLPNTQEELEALLAEEAKKRQKFDLEKALGKLKKTSDLVELKRRIARISTKITEQKIKNKKQKI